MYMLVRQTSQWSKNKIASDIRVFLNAFLLIIIFFSFSILWVRPRERFWDPPPKKKKKIVLYEITYNLFFVSLFYN